jgi:hypothetical protein
MLKLLQATRALGLEPKARIGTDGQLPIVLDALPPRLVGGSTIDDQPGGD